MRTEGGAHPFGDEITSTSNDREKFATYARDTGPSCLGESFVSVCDMGDSNSAPVGVPSDEGTSETPTCEQLLTGAIGSFLSGKNSPLAGYAALIVGVGQTDKVDPTLIAALAIAENGSAQNNPFALGPNGTSTITTLDQAISKVGSVLNKYIYTWNESTVSALWSGNTLKVNPKKPWITTQPGYCAGTDAAAVKGCQNTGAKIAGFMQSIGSVATVGGNQNQLGFPCPD